MIYRKKERHEMGKVANAKLDHKVRDDNDLVSLLIILLRRVYS